MNKLITFLARAFQQIVSTFFDEEIEYEKGLAKNLIEAFDREAKKEYARADALTDLASEIAIHAAAQKARARDLNGLVGRLEKAVG